MTSIFKVGDQTIRPGRAWRDSDGTLQPKNWNIWSEEEKKAAGISEVASRMKSKINRLPYSPKLTGP